ncbi:hypothetical protein MBLNU459_g5532t1 [Dothideomycetes sp. NU459]
MTKLSRTYSRPLKCAPVMGMHQQSPQVGRSSSGSSIKINNKRVEDTINQTPRQDHTSKTSAGKGETQMRPTKQSTEVVESEGEGKGKGAAADAAIATVTPPVSAPNMTGTEAVLAIPMLLFPQSSIDASRHHHAARAGQAHNHWL